MRIAFFGTPQIAADVLDFLVEKGIDVVAVISRPDRPKGRSSKLVATPVKQVAEQRGITAIYQPEKASDSDFCATLAAHKPDLFVVVAYGEIMRQHLLDIPKLGCINLHASLLPKYRGAAPIHRSIIEGEHETGVTIMKMVRKMDAGDMLKQVKVPIGPDMTAGELQQALCAAGKQALLEVVHAYEQGPLEGIPQDESQVTFAPKIEREECEVDWNKPSQILHNLIRGSTPAPGAWCAVTVRGEKKQLKLKRTRLESDKNGSPGEILEYNKNGPLIACGKGALRLTELQLEGKKAVLGDVFVQGVPHNAIEFNLGE